MISRCLLDHVPILQAIWERVKSHRGSTASMQGHGSKDLQQRTPFLTSQGIPEDCMSQLRLPMMFPQFTLLNKLV